MFGDSCQHFLCLLNIILAIFSGGAQASFFEYCSNGNPILIMMDENETSFVRKSKIQIIMFNDFLFFFGTFFLF